MWCVIGACFVLLEITCFLSTKKFITTLFTLLNILCKNKLPITLYWHSVNFGTFPWKEFFKALEFFQIPVPMASFLILLYKKINIWFSSLPFPLFYCTSYTANFKVCAIHFWFLKCQTYFLFFFDKFQYNFIVLFFYSSSNSCGHYTNKKTLQHLI